MANASVNWRHRSDTTLTFNVRDGAGTGIPVTAADAGTTYFQTGTYDYIDLAFGFGIAKRYSLRLSGNNLFDTDPPLLPNARNVLGLLRNDTLMGHDLLGRQIVAGVTATF